MFTWVEIDSKAINYNLKQFRKIIGPNRLLMPVIKANAYGHGFLEIAKICSQNKVVDRICVVNSDEATFLIEMGIKKPIMILSFFVLDEKILLKLAKNKVIFPLFSLKQAKTLNKVGDRLNKKIKVHLKIDTGTSRIGVLPQDLKKFIQSIKYLKYLEIEGVWSHFASSEDDAQYTQKQYDNFQDALKILKNNRVEPRIKHMSCSAATVAFKLEGFNAIRLGLSLYGLHPAEQTRNKVQLKPALTWNTTIIQTKIVPTGTKIGYGNTYTTKKTSKLAIIPVGYYDGYDRRFSNQGQVLINGVKCPVRGRICMNLTIVDITGVEAGEGDRVILIGKQKNNIITVDELAKIAQTINYEIVDRINPLIPRRLK